MSYMKSLGNFKEGDVVEVEILRGQEKKVLKAEL